MTKTSVLLTLGVLEVALSAFLAADKIAATCRQGEVTVSFIVNFFRLLRDVRINRNYRSDLESFLKILFALFIFFAIIDLIMTHFKIHNNIVRVIPGFLIILIFSFGIAVNFKSYIKEMIFLCIMISLSPLVIYHYDIGEFFVISKIFSYGYDLNILLDPIYVQMIVLCVIFFVSGATGFAIYTLTMLFIPIIFLLIMGVTSYLAEKSLGFDRGLVKFIAYILLIFNALVIAFLKYI